MPSPTQFHPGAYTPDAGEYVCDCAGEHRWRIDMAGHLFPVFPPNCSADAWCAVLSDGKPQHTEPRLRT